MKKKTVKVFGIILIVLLIALSIPGIKYLWNYFKWGETYSEQFATEWVSEDKHLSFIINNSKGIQGTGIYKGNYIDDLGMEHEINVLFDTFFDVRLSNTIESSIAYGHGKMNYFADTFTVTIEEVYSNCSIYKSGDIIVFRKK